MPRGLTVRVSGRGNQRVYWAFRSAALVRPLAQQHLRNILAYLDVRTLGQPEAFIQAKEGLFDEAGDIGSESRVFLQTWMDRYVAWVKQHSASLVLEDAIRR